MNLPGNVSTLKAKHNDLEQSISTENNRPNPDVLVIATLKKEKLRIKDQITYLKH